MLKEKVDTLRKDYLPMKETYEAIQCIGPTKEVMDKTCEKLRGFLERAKQLAVDEEIRTGIESVYRILEVAIKGLEDPNVSALLMT